jgi:CheY-like chemotaxis protein
MLPAMSPVLVLIAGDKRIRITLGIIVPENNTSKVGRLWPIVLREKNAMSGEYILLVEDDVVLAMGLETCLNMDGYRVTRVFDGEQALAACKQEVPDLVISDVVMEIMDGLTLLRHLRDSTEWTDLPVILISGHANQGIHEEALDLGVDDFLYKPFDVNFFLRAVHASLNN